MSTQNSLFGTQLSQPVLRRSADHIGGYLRGRGPHWGQLAVGPCWLQGPWAHAGLAFRAVRESVFSISVTAEAGTRAGRNWVAADRRSDWRW